jgi:hypothetical protein
MKRLTKHATPSTFIAFLALIFAVTGVSFAATGATGTGGGKGNKNNQNLVASTAKAKKKAPVKSTRGPAGPKGATGATGATGAAGATGPGGPAGAGGAKGENGAAGAPGTNGTGTEGKAGTSVTSKTIASGGSECAGQGGVKLTPGGNICNGTTGFTKTLPAGQTETGAWSYASSPAAYRCFPDTGKGNFTNSNCTTSGPAGTSNYEQEAVYSNGGFADTTISFPIPLEAGLSDEGCEETSKSPCQVYYLKSGETVSGHCEGEVEAPTAVLGNLCVYASSEEEIEAAAVLAPGKVVLGFPQSLAHWGAGVSGARVLLETKNGAQNISALGTWAVTAE